MALSYTDFFIRFFQTDFSGILLIALHAGSIEIELAGLDVKMLIFTDCIHDFIGGDIHQIKDDIAAGTLKVRMVFDDGIIPEITFAQIEFLNQLHLAQSLQ